MQSRDGCVIVDHREGMSGIERFAECDFMIKVHFISACMAIGE